MIRPESAVSSSADPYGTWTNRFRDSTSNPRDVLLRIGRGRLGFKFTTGFIGYDEPLSQEQNGTRTRATCLYPTTGTVASFGLEDMEIDFA